MAYSIGALYKSNKETLSDGSVKTVNAHKQFILVLKELFTRAGWTILDYKENYLSDYSAVESTSTYTSNDEIEQRRLFVTNAREDIYMVFETGCDFSKDAFNIGVWTFPSYDSTKDLHQQDYFNVKTIIASNDSLEYFVTCDDDHLYGFLYINNQYSSHFHLGYFEQFETKENYPFAVICATQYRSNSFTNSINPPSGDIWFYNMGENETGASSSYIRNYNNSHANTLNMALYKTVDCGNSSMYDRNYGFAYWGPYCTGWPNYPTDGEYGLGELFIKSVSGAAPNSDYDRTVISKSVFAGKLKGIYKISGYNIYTKYVVQIGGIEITPSESTPASVKGYVDAIKQSGGRAFIVANDLNRIGAQNYVALEMI